MNKANMLQLIDVLKTLDHDTNNWRDEPNGFCLNYLRYECGTPACIAGWAAALALRTSHLPNDIHIERTAADWLGLDHNMAYNRLFYPDRFLPPGAQYEDVGPKWAAEVLRTMANATDPMELNMREVWEEARPAGNGCSGPVGP